MMKSNYIDFMEKLKELENKLNPMIFIRVNSGVFVNFNYIYIISGYKISDGRWKYIYDK